MFVCDFIFILFRIIWRPPAGIELFLGFRSCYFNFNFYAIPIVCTFSRQVSGAGCEIRLYRFLVIVVSSSLSVQNDIVVSSALSHTMCEWFICIIQSLSRLTSFTTTGEMFIKAGSASAFTHNNLYGMKTFDKFQQPHPIKMTKLINSERLFRFFFFFCWCIIHLPPNCF